MNNKIVLAGGCFWGLEDLIRAQPGVLIRRSAIPGEQMKTLPMKIIQVTPKLLRLNMIRQ
jgi:peptide methionine sulfoxide reductase MsrA